METKDAQGWYVIAIAVIVPWLTWWTLTTSDANMAVTETPIFLSGLALLGVLCLHIGKTDQWLAALAGYLLIRTLPLSSPYAFEAAYLTVLSAFAIHAMSEVSAPTITRLKAMVLAGGVLQVSYGMLQWFGHDPMWIPWAQVVDPGLHIRGTLGNRNFFGAYAAICLVLGPVWLMPWFFVGLIMAKSVTPIVACAIGLAWRYRQSRMALASAAALLVSGGIWAYLRENAILNLHYRWDVWWFAVTDWFPSHPFLGMGTGQWANRIPAAQLRGEVSSISQAVFVAAHNDWLQLVYEGGLIAAVLLGLWFWSRKGLFMGPSGGAVVVIGVNALGNFPFHVGTTALLALVVLGLALAEERSGYEEVSRGPRWSGHPIWRPLEWPSLGAGLSVRIPGRH